MSSPEPEGEFTADLLALAYELRRVAGLPAGQAMLALGVLADHTAPESVLAVMRRARRRAAVKAVADAGGRTALARDLGVSATLVSRAVGDNRRHAPPKSSVS